MTRRTRFFVTLIVALALPLRVYAAAVMLFCAPGHAASATDLLHATHAAVTHDASMHAHHAPAGDSGGNEVHDTGGAQASHDAHDTTCSACSSVALIASGSSEFAFLPFATPAAPPFAHVALHSFVADGRYRPPRHVLV